VTENHEQPDEPVPGKDTGPASDTGPWDDSWRQLPAPDRAAHVMSEIEAGRALAVMARPLDPDFLLIMALVRAVREDRPADFALLLKHTSPCEQMRLLVTAVKMISEHLDEGAISTDWASVWASFAITR